jgi:hypothetical protein
MKLNITLSDWEQVSYEGDSEEVDFYAKNSSENKKNTKSHVCL